MNSLIKVFFTLSALSACFGAFKAPSSATTSYNSSVMVNPTTKVLTSPSATDLGNANRFLMYDENRNVTVSSLFSSTASITGNATFSSDVSVQQNLNADTITETGGGINATLGGITASTLSAQAATFSSLTLSPTQWYAVFILTPPDYTSRWTDFILKGAEQTGALAAAIYDLKFCYISADPAQSVYTQTHSAMPIPYFTNNTSVDGRVWIKQFNNRSISGMIGDNARVGGWCVVVRETGSWFNPYNQKLVWSWVPSTSTELLSYSGNVIWSPIQPSYWTQTPPNP